jgi:prepilin-type N-terminal cleavage/methylation domain-containing protein
MNKIKKGFTLAEILVTLATIGVVAGITIPVLNNAKIDKDTVVYRKALYSLQQAAHSFMNGTGYQKMYREADKPSEDLFLNNLTNKQVCEGLADEMNTRGKIDCNLHSGNSDEPNFITTDGIAFYNLGGNSNFEHKVVFVKRIAERKSETEARKKKEGTNGNGYLRILINYRGKVYVPVDGQPIKLPNGQYSQGYSFPYEQSLINNYTKLNQRF